ncbi:MAG: GlsB/YeaQ/YmgE family stress response membrane protein [Thermomicrobiales bacterium]|nr:GlsB/YeaQ/YmgE family stress response membrane protein [Thermomicrobiales bacterium]
MESNLGILSWIVFGALAGWVASLLVGDYKDPQGCLANIIIGIVGAFLGGFIYTAATGRPVVVAWDLGSFVVAVIGAIVLLAVLRLIRR